jgi:hypothetical protein
MPKTQKLHFEQVPLAVARRVGLERIRLSQPGTIRCEICAKIVELETCKIDENGRAVHGDCYVLKLAKGSEPARPRIAI